MPDMNKPLAGMTVVSLEQAVAAPLCACRLRDAGARVIKVERPDGDFARGYDTAVHGLATYFVWTNRGKESVVLDLKDPDDLALLHRILAKADVFIQNLAPGAAERLGLGSEKLRAAYRRLVTCDITGYGAGPYESMKAYDFLVQCESGLVATSGAPGAPGRIGVSICDIGAGMNAAEGVIAALLLRERTGENSGVTVSLFDTAVDWMSVPLAHYEFAGQVPEPMGMKHPAMAPYGAFPTRDGRQVVLSIQNNREWVRLCEVIGRPELGSDPRYLTMGGRVERRPEVDAAVGAYTASKDFDELRPVFDRAQIAYAAVNTVVEMATHPQVRRWPMTIGGVEASWIAPPIQTPADEGRFPDLPELGEHTDKIRAEFAA